MFDKQVTIFNKKYDKDKRDDVYKRTILHGVHTEMTRSSDFRDKGMSANDTFFVNIPFLIAGYTKPKQYQDLKEVNTEWTLQEGDIIVIGTFDHDIQSPKCLKGIDDVYVIKSIETIDYSVIGLNHFEVYAS